MAITEQHIENRMNVHVPTADQKIAIDELRSLLKIVTLDVIGIVPEGREQSLMVTHLEEALMWGVKGIVAPVSS